MVALRFVVDGKTELSENDAITMILGSLSYYGDADKTIGSLRNHDGNGNDNVAEQKN